MSRVNWGTAIMTMVIPVLVNIVFYYFIDYAILNKITVAVIIISFLTFVVARLKEMKGLDLVVIFILNALNITAYIIYYFVK